MEKFDLTPKMLMYLDRQLGYPLLEFMTNRGIYNDHDLEQAKFELLSNTNMVDFVGDLYSKAHDGQEPPAEFSEKREKVMKQLEEFELKTEKIRSVIEMPEVASSLRQDRVQNMQFLTENYQCKPEMVKDLYDFGQFHYSCGNYGGSADLLFHFSVLSTDTNLILKAMWGKLASEMLIGNWETAYEDVIKLREAIEKSSFAEHAQQLQNRVWLLHWSLFVFFNHPNGRDGILEMMLMPQYSNTIQNACPWLVRYLVAASVVNRRRRNNIKEVVKIVNNLGYLYSDPLTEFISALYINFDFDLACIKLKECELVLENDFFLTGASDDFVDCARLYFAEVYCKIYSRIDLSKLTAKLNMEQEDGEKWIVKLIRETRLDAKVNLKDNYVVINPQVNHIPQQVIEKTKFLSFRSQVLNGAIDKRQAYLAKQSAQAEAALVEQ
ncbi:Eukaryotic translation initiation factor 3 subunit E [Smittium culicis]|uniref:Eukaryotic translation initiation factor 3 subunit E n=1 Tax=Smittium culicis TaxID=133412 RepID=A0A1R1XDI9_9FUNG|nr:Eukaryotic translation initiation factor 3 subunit E [Smittium culicis]OMJ18946.1 Eukaryotic translation initiation factor 3 subunit E [Smittium culicis]